VRISVQPGWGLGTFLAVQLEPVADLKKKRRRELNLFVARSRSAGGAQNVSHAL
jgi:hypothetical protein